MKKEIKIAICIFIFVIGTIMAYLSPDSTIQKRQFNLDLDSSAGNNQNKGIKIQNADIDMQLVKINNDDVSNTNIAINNSGDINTSNDVNQVDDVQNKVTENTEQYEEELQNKTPEGYLADSKPSLYTEIINWNIWRSNFLNKILDDCDSIPSLNYYKSGTWIRISFNVLNTGEIDNISIISLGLRQEDKIELEKMIKRYAHKPITVFPGNSKRKSVNVRTIMILDDEEKRARPEDFHDREKVHYE